MLFRSELAALFAAIGLFVKKNAVVLVAVLGVFGFCFLIRRRMSFSRPVLILFILLLGLIGSASLDRIKSFDPKRMEVLANQLKVSNEVSHLFVPEPGAFLREPFLNPWSKGPNLDHLPNYFWKSSLFGEWSFDFPASDKLAIVISGILLVLLAISGIAWLKTPSALPFLLILNSFGAIASYRFLYPFSCNGDFRFVYPYVVFGIALTLAQAKGSLLKRLARWVSLFFLLVFQVFLLFFWIGEIG